MKKVKVVADSGMEFFATVQKGIAGADTLIIKERTMIKRSGNGCRGYISREDVPAGFSQFQGRGDYVKFIPSI